MAGILDLPTEILVGILENRAVSETTLYFLALVCRRLHFVALPIYFSRHGLTPSSKSIVIAMVEDRRDVLAALKTALFIPHTENIRCIFPHPSCCSIFPLLLHLTRLENYISRLPSVKHVTLCLDVRGSMCLSVGNDDGLRAWAASLESLLNCIVKKQCECLTMVYGAQFTKAYQLTSPPIRRGKMMHLLSAVPRLARTRRPTSEIQEFRRDPRQGHTHIEMALPSIHHSSNLSSLEIYSAILVLPPGLYWTLTALRTCPITSLTLGWRGEESIPWRTVLPLIASAASQLTSITLCEADVIFGYTDSSTEVGILDFISRFPQLRHIAISYNVFTDFGATDGPLLDLPNVETLSAPSPFILHMLRSPSSLPNIQSICVVWPQPHLSRITHLLATALHPILHKSRPPRLSVCVTTSMYHSTFFTVPIGDTAFSDRVEALEIIVARFPWTDVAEMAGWIGLFPRVRQVDIELSDSTEPGFHAAVARLVKSTDLLDKIKVNGVVYSLSDRKAIPSAS
ncbi:hypothetical protein B0H12DRAFT_1239651 [Mycena haematopus]|nr:hypothetical protein B0H12DRAFT_1239651 [Mycena haematopus]